LKQAWKNATALSDGLEQRAADQEQEAAPAPMADAQTFPTQP
jgi:hypothetical protein